MKKKKFFLIVIFLSLSILIGVASYVKVQYSIAKQKKHDLKLLTEYMITKNKSNVTLSDVENKKELIERYVNVLSGLSKTMTFFDKEFSSTPIYKGCERGGGYKSIMVCSFSCLLGENEISYQDYVRIKIALATTCLDHPNERVKAYGRSVIEYFPFIVEMKSGIDLSSLEEVIGAVNVIQFKTSDITPLVEYLTTEEKNSYCIDDYYIENWTFYVYRSMEK